MIGFFDTVNRLKPGLVCYAMAIEHYMSDGRDRHDFMVGAGRYKTSFGGIDTLSLWPELAGAGTVGV